MAVDVKTINGLGYASVKTKNGLAVASLKTINGLDVTSVGGATLIAHTGGGGDQDGTAPTPAIDTTGANLMVVSVSWYFGVTGAGTLTDSKGNTWTGLTSVATTSFKSQLFYCFNPAVGSGHTVSYAGTFTVPVICVSAWSGIVTSPFDAENGAFNNSASTISTGSISASQDALVISGFMTAEAGATGMGATGFTLLDEVPGTFGQNLPGAHAYKIIPAGSANASWSYTGAANEVIAVGASFKC